MIKDRNWLKEEISKQINILHTTISSGNYVSSVKRAEILNLIDQLEEPEQEKVVIPQFVADWIEECREMDVRLGESFNTHYEDNREIHTWIYNSDDKNSEIYARAWLDGYTVEKEKLYQVVFPFTGSSEKTLIQSIFTGNTWADDVEDDFEFISEDHKVEFTEQEIKAIDERFWAFAEEITE